MRSVPEWIGKTDDESAPDRVRLRLFQKRFGVCAICSRQLRAGHWDLDHKVAICNGGENRESNLWAVCDVPCHRNKTKADVAEKSAAYQQQLSHTGARKRKSSFQTNKDGPFKKCMDGTTKRR
jgi:5-methylcytosine-specific restriction protein A